MPWSLSLKITLMGISPHQGRSSQPSTVPQARARKTSTRLEAQRQHLLPSPLTTPQLHQHPSHLQLKGTRKNFSGSTRKVSA